jgi:hypothetical protein
MTMHPHVKEIYNKAHKEVIDYCSYTGAGGLRMELDEEQFANLLIIECILVLQKRYMGDNSREDQEVLRCVEALRNYFFEKPVDYD